jgi:gamma-glutamyltranspeptidase/glutathione hydrolase
VAYHPIAREVGEKILQEGGNAFDAFVAVTAAENVLAEGASSLAGPLAVMIYSAKDGEVTYLDADFNDPLDPKGRWTAEDPKRGKTALVPGAPAGLEALAVKYGTMPFSKLLEPAITLAEEGFPVNILMESLITLRESTLKQSEYGRLTYFRDGKPLSAGDTIRLWEMAAFLRTLAAEGPDHVYRGEWGKQFIKVVRAGGGLLTTDDLNSYTVNWHPPWTTSYRGYTLHSSSGPSYGGIWVLLALKTLEHADFLPEKQYWVDADALEKMLRIARQVWSETFLLDHHVLSDPAIVQSKLSPEHTWSIWQRVQNRTPAHPMGIAGPHSYHIIVTDGDGNLASGTTTIESRPWGEGMFVEGVPLPISGMFPWHTEPGKRRLSPFPIHFAFRSDRPRFAVGTISVSYVEAAFQLLANLIDYSPSPRDAVSVPRFGTFPITEKSKTPSLQLDRNWLDPRVDKRVVRQLKKHGIRVVQKGQVDTGLGTVLAMGEQQTSEGITLPLPYFSRPFESPC